jgi:hypothetical protein
MNTFEELMSQITSLIQLFINDKNIDTDNDTDNVGELSDRTVDELIDDIHNLPPIDEYDDRYDESNINILNTIDRLRKMEKKQLDININYYYKHKTLITCEYCSKQMSKNTHYKGKKCRLAKSLI